MTSKRFICLAAVAIGVAALAAYHNSFSGPFVFDDITSVLENPSIRHLWPLSGPLNPPKDFGFTVSGRPVLNLSLALNYAAGGTSPVGYHVVNLLIHLAAGLVLFGLVRRTLMQPALSGKLREQAGPVALVVALAWTLHPLQTESVTYVIQRAESLMGLFYLLTLYGFVRLAEPAGGKGWGVASVLACALGMGCKEVMVTAPVLVLLYDRVFCSGGFREAVRRRPAYYVALALTWLPLAGLVLSTGGDRGGTFRLSVDAFMGFWLTQPEALTRYLGLTLWPHPLVFEYGMVTHNSPAAITGYSLVTGAFLALTVWLWRRHKPAGFGLAGFLLVLAPTSLMPGTSQIIAEHRLYVPLAGLLAVLVASAAAWLGRRGLAVCLGLALVGGVATVARNRVYQDGFTLWSDTLQKRPTSAKAHNNLGHAYYHQGDFNAAIRHFEQAARLEPGMPQPHFNLGLALQDAGRSGEAIKAYTEAVRILPDFAQAHALLGVLLVKEGRTQEAAVHLQAAYMRNPNLAEVHLGMGLLLAADGRDADAVQGFERALQLAPGLGQARLGLGVALARQGRLPEAVAQLRQLVAEAPAMPEAHANLGIALAESGDLAAALVSYAEALRLQPGYAKAHYNLGNAFIQLQRWDEAREQFETAVRLEPGFTAAQEMLARMKSQPPR